MPPTVEQRVKDRAMFWVVVKSRTAQHFGISLADINRMPVDRFFMLREQIETDIENRKQQQQIQKQKNELRKQNTPGGRGTFRPKS